jgi:Skp family chaperone for outer membrane proteins
LKIKKSKEKMKERNVMKIRLAIILSCLTGVIFLSIGYEYSRAEQKADTPGLKIGVVSVRKILRGCKRSAEYKDEVLADQGRTNAELEELFKQIEAQEAGLKALKPGSSDYLAQFKELVDKRYGLEAQREFNKQQSALKYHQWTEELYKEILQITRELAEQKGLDLVFERDEPEFPVNSSEELMMTLNTHKLLYSVGCSDLTNEVLARLDAKQ